MRSYILSLLCYPFIIKSTTLHAFCLSRRLHQTARPLGSIDSSRLIRGDAYGGFNSTIPAAAEVALSLGVRPPDEVSARVWKRAFAVLKYATPILHLLDSQKPPNSSLNLYCMWWKALSGNDRKSPVYDQRLASSLLPRSSRWIVRYPNLFPRLHHANVEIRTAYLDSAVEYFASMHNSTKKIRLISFGAGYDTRSIKLKLLGVIDSAVEFDLADVVASKKELLGSTRFQRRLKILSDKHDIDDASSLPPSFVEVDLNDLEAVKPALQKILLDDQHTNFFSILLFEAVMIYLDEGVPSALLEICHSAMVGTSSGGALCFADRLENIPGGDKHVCDQEMLRLGWKIVDWSPKPGLARHMGRAIPIPLRR